MKYLVKYDNVLIGLLYVEPKSVKYEVNKENLEKLRSNGVILLPILRSDRYSKDIPFFTNMIRNCKRFNAKIKYHNNKLMLEEIEEEDSNG